MLEKNKSIWEIKHRILELLYAYPMTDYSKNNSINVAIHGTEDVCMEALKAVYTCGQAMYINEKGVPEYYNLIIDIFTPNTNYFEQTMNSTMPGISTFKDENSNLLATINVNSNLDFSATIKELSYSYVIAFDKVPEFLQKKRYKNMLIAEYIGETKGFRTYQDKNVGYISNRVRKEINQLNLNQKYINILADDNCAPYIEAIKKQNKHYKEDDKYNYDSSFACTIHIPYKLALFGKDRNTAIEALESLLNNPDKKNDIKYRALITLEHRRWVAHMISEGYISPSKSEFSKYAYTSGHTHKNMVDKLHPCICNCGTNPFYLSTNKTYMDSNNDKFEESSLLSDLDKFSIRCHQLCKARAINKKNDKDFIAKLTQLRELNNQVVDEYLQIVSNLIEDEHFNDMFLYDTYKKRAASVAETLVKSLDSDLSIFKARNKKTDYSLLDVNIIDGLLFDIWHMQKYRTLIIPCTGNAVKDITMAVYLSCKKIILFLNKNDENSCEEEKLINIFFDNREAFDKDVCSTCKAKKNDGTDNSACAGCHIKKNKQKRTKIIFEHIDFDNISNISSVINKHIEKNNKAKDSVAIDCSNIGEGVLPLVLGQLTIPSDDIALLHYKNGDVFDYRNGKSISCGIKKCFTIKEYLGLSGAEIKNELEIMPTIDEETKLFRIFREFSPLIKPSLTKKGEPNKYSVWSYTSTFLQNAASNADIDEFFGISNKDNRYGVVRDLKIDSDIFDYFNVDSLIKELEKRHIIANYKVKDQSVISFDSPNLMSAQDEKICKFFHELSKWNSEKCSTDRVIWFSDVQEDISNKEGKTNNNSKNNKKDKMFPIGLLENKASFSDTNNKMFMNDSNAGAQQRNKDRQECLKRLYAEHIIKNLSNPEVLTQTFDEGSHIITDSDFDFSTASIKKLFKVHGKIFEMYLYRKIGELGLFSDIKTGVKIGWDKNHSWNYYEKLDEYFNKISETRNKNILGISAYLDAKLYIKENYKGYTSNEIDVILMKDMKIIFISCKTGAKIEKDWLYEISSVAAHFNAIPVLAVSFDLTQLKNENEADLARAKNMGISLIGSDTTYKQKKLRACMMNILDGKVVSILDK